MSRHVAAANLVAAFGKDQLSGGWSFTQPGQRRSSCRPNRRGRCRDCECPQSAKASTDSDHHALKLRGSASSSEGTQPRGPGVREPPVGGEAGPLSRVGGLPCSRSRCARWRGSREPRMRFFQGADAWPSRGRHCANHGPWPLRRNVRPHDRLEDRPDHVGGDGTGADRRLTRQSRVGSTWPVKETPRRGVPGGLDKGRAHVMQGNVAPRHHVYRRA
jgi:hypothetical protein